MGDTETRREWPQLLRSNKKRILFLQQFQKTTCSYMYSWRFVDYDNNLNEWCWTFSPGWFIAECDGWMQDVGSGVIPQGNTKNQFSSGRNGKRLHRKAGSVRFFKCSVLHVTVGFSLSGATWKRSSPHTVMLSTPGIKITERQKQTQTIKRCVHLFSLNMHVWRRCLT